MGEEIVNSFAKAIQAGKVHHHHPSSSDAINDLSNSLANSTSTITGQTQQLPVIPDQSLNDTSVHINNRLITNHTTTSSSSAASRPTSADDDVKSLASEEESPTNSSAIACDEDGPLTMMSNNNSSNNLTNMHNNNNSISFTSSSANTTNNTIIENGANGPLIASDNNSPALRKLQEYIRRNVEEYQHDSLNTANISRLVRELLSKHNIGQRLFAKFVLNLSQGTVSELLSKPKPWDKLTEKGRDSYRKMHAWAVDNKCIELLQSLVPRKGKQITYSVSPFYFLHIFHDGKFEGLFIALYFAFSSVTSEPLKSNNNFFFTIARLS